MFRTAWGRRVGIALVIMAGLACLGAVCVGDLPREAIGCDWQRWAGHDGPGWGQDESGPVIVFQWDAPDFDSDDEECARAQTGALYAIRDDGTDLVRLSPSGGNRSWAKPGTAYDTSPVVSPDGTLVAYATLRHSRCLGEYDIVTVRTDGEERRRLTENACTEELDSSKGEPAWSPDGTRIAFLVEFDAYFDQRGYLNCGVLHAMAADGSEPRRLAPGVSAVWEPPVWSPDGKWLAFRGNPDTAACSLDVGLYLAAADGSHVKRVAEALWDVHGHPPAWSPDGGRVAFFGRWAEVREEVEYYYHDIFVLDLQEGLKRITRDAWAEGPMLWSPDGTEILVYGDPEWDGRRPEPGLMAVAVDAVDEEHSARWVARLSWNRIEGMAWSPEGERIAVRLRPFSLNRRFFDTQDGPGADIVLYTVALDGSHPVVLVREGPEGELLTATWEEAR